MIILSIETSMGASSVAVLFAGAPPRIFIRSSGSVRDQAENLLPMINAAMAESGAAFRDLTHLAVSVGPGSFTGVRAGLAAARGFALALNLPSFPASSLEIIARQAAKTGVMEQGQTFAVATLAGRGDLYMQIFDEQGAASTRPALFTADEAAAFLPPAVMLAVGPGGAELAAAAMKAGRPLRSDGLDLMPNAQTLAHMAAGGQASFAPPAPLYLKAADAKPQQSKVLIRATAGK